MDVVFSIGNNAAISKGRTSWANSAPPCPAPATPAAMRMPMLATGYGTSIGNDLVIPDAAAEPAPQLSGAAAGTLSGAPPTETGPRGLGSRTIRLRIAADSP